MPLPRAFCCIILQFIIINVFLIRQDWERARGARGARGAPLLRWGCKLNWDISTRDWLRPWLATRNSQRSACKFVHTFFVQHCETSLVNSSTKISLQPSASCEKHSVSLVWQPFTRLYRCSRPKGARRRHRAQNVNRYNPSSSVICSV